MPPNEPNVTVEKVLFGFILMASAGRVGLSSEDIAKVVTNLQAECITALLNDETGEAREQVRGRMENLWAIYEEHDPTTNPWDLAT